MRISVTDAKGQLTELVRRAEKGHEIILIRDGHPAVRLVPVKAPADRKSRRVLLEAAGAAGAAKATAGPSAARSQDSSTMMTGCHDDHCRHPRVDGDCARRA